MKFRGLNLNLLVAMDALLAERCITRAGERILLSQSAMSGALELHTLESLPGNGFTVCCFPAKIRGASAGWTHRTGEPAGTD
jgi:kynurenine formamidase